MASDRHQADLHYMASEGHVEPCESAVSQVALSEIFDSGANRHDLCTIPLHTDVDPARTYRNSGESSGVEATGFGVGVVPGAKGLRGRYRIGGRPRDYNAAGQVSPSGRVLPGCGFSRSTAVYGYKPPGNICRQ